MLVELSQQPRYDDLRLRWHAFNIQDSLSSCAQRPQHFEGLAQTIALLSQVGRCK